MTDDAAQGQTVPSTYERLAEPFALSEHATVNKGGGDQTYAPWTAYVERLDHVIGSNNWSNRIIREGFTDTECWVLVEVEAIIDGQKVVRQQYGSEPITKGRDAKPTTDLLKSTASDALKKAISLLGPGLYLSVKEEREVVQAAMREAVREAARADAEARRNANKPKEAPKTVGDEVRDRASARRIVDDGRVTKSNDLLTPEVKAAAQLTGAPRPAPPQPAGYFCVECQGLVKTDGNVTILKKKDGPKVSVPVADFAPVVEQRLGGFHCPGCYEKKWFQVA